MPKTIRDIDASVGSRLRLRRKELAISQTEMGEKVGVSFQQIQKYENGKNRMSAGALYLLSKALSVPVTYFFKDCETESKPKGRKRTA